MQINIVASVFQSAQALAKFRLRPNLVSLGFIRFLFSSGVGNNSRTLANRFSDFTELRLYFANRKVLEFGTGSSTLFFLNSANKVSSLTSFEQDEKYLPKFTKRTKNYNYVLSDVTSVRIAEMNGTMFEGANQYINNSDFIYIDGPVSPNNSHIDMAGPNLDVFYANTLKDKVIAVDRRHATVALLAIKLSETHRLITTKSFVSDLPKLEKLINVAQIESIIDFKSEIALKRTSVFFPK